MNTSSKILLHCCCGPCSLATIDYLSTQGFSVTALFYNPNIEPIERQKRKEAWEAVCIKKGIHTILLNDEIDSNMLENQRCGFCFEARLSKSNQISQELGINYFTTTLLISPFQNHELLKKISNNFERFKYFDLRALFEESQKQAKTLEIYRQKFCGCVHSKQESIWIQKRREEAKRPKLGPCQDWKPKWL